MNYTTQMDAAKKGIITKEMETVAAKESIDVEFIRKGLAVGTMVIPANKNHKSLSAEGVGAGLKTKINVNLGISKDCYSMEAEMDKVRCLPAMIGTVPMYDLIGFYDRELKEIKAEEFLNVVEKLAADGVDFVTIHAGINRETANVFKRNKRLTNIVSRGGSLLYAWMELTGNENPFFEYYDDLLDICVKHDVTLSLGDACQARMHPGCNRRLPDKRAHDTGRAYTKGVEEECADNY